MDRRRKSRPGRARRRASGPRRMAQRQGPHGHTTDAPRGARVLSQGRTARTGTGEVRPPLIAPVIAMALPQLIEPDIVARRPIGGSRSARRSGSWTWCRPNQHLRLTVLPERRTRFVPAHCRISHRQHRANIATGKQPQLESNQTVSNCRRSSRPSPRRQRRHCSNLRLPSGHFRAGADRAVSASRPNPPLHPLPLRSG